MSTRPDDDMPLSVALDVVQRSWHRSTLLPYEEKAWRTLLVELWRIHGAWMVPP